MRSHVRIALLVMLSSTALAAASVPAAQGAFGVKEFLAGVCTTSTCTGENPAEFYTQAAGRPNFGITDFKFNVGVTGAPEGAVKNLRVDVPEGLLTNPEAVPKCAMKAFEENLCKAESEIGTDTLTVFVGIDVSLPGVVYNLEQPPGVPAEFGVNVSLGPLALPGSVHTLLEGGVSWQSDYHESFEIHEISNALPLVESRLAFNGRAGTGFLTNPSACSGPQTTLLKVESYEAQRAEKTYTTPVGANGCDLVPFEPSINLLPGTTQSDQPDGARTEVLVPQFPEPTHIASSDVRVASVTLPEGMTLNPAAASGLEACTAAQIGIHTTNPVTCPVASQVGNVTIETPVLPPGSLAGKVYLGEDTAGPITGPPYTIYVDAESARYGLSVRLKGTVTPNPTTGRLVTTFAENPQAPFSRFILSFNSGAHAPLANPLECGAASTEASLTPFSRSAPEFALSKFNVDSNGSGGACPAPLPFALSQSTAASSPNAGAFSAFTLNLARADGQQYLGKISTTLPPGVLGAIPSVKLCEEPQAAAGTCSSESKVGEATVTAGAGTAPQSFTGPAYLTGPYNGAPYGMSIAVPAVAGPFNLGTIVTRAQINVDPLTSRLIVTSSLPTIVGGIPLRLKTISVAVNRPNFLVNPTNCSVLQTESTLTSTFGAAQLISTPFQVGNCAALAFKPNLTASAGGKTSKANGVSFGVKIGYPKGTQANIQSVFVQLPKQLPSRLKTLQKACTEATFKANPYACPAGSRVGGATVVTPVLPGKLSGPAYFVSHGGAAFPDLDLVLTGPNGIHVILVGNTNIKGSITTSTFASVPDVPVSSFELNLPVGANSALTATGNLCKSTLTMPTVVTAQSGKQIKQNTKIAITGCGVVVTKAKTKGTKAVLTVKLPAAGRISGSGNNIKTVVRYLSKAGNATLNVPLSSGGVNKLRRNHHLKVKIRVGFVPKKKGPSSKTFVTLTFKG